jgi:hypothetical protein
VGNKIANWPDFLNPFGLTYFVVTVDLALFLIATIVAWGVVKSTRVRQHEPEIPGRLTQWVGALVIILFVSAFCEAQPFVLDALAQTSPTPFTQSALAKINKFLALLAPVGGVIAFLASKIGEFIKSATESPKVRVQIAGLVAKIAIYFAGSFWKNAMTWRRFNWRRITTWPAASTPCT